jgi:hypothetical protein
MDELYDDLTAKLYSLYVQEILETRIEVHWFVYIFIVYVVVDDLLTGSLITFVWPAQYWIYI